MAALIHCFFFPNFLCTKANKCEKYAINIFKWVLMIILLGLFDFKYLPQTPAMHTSLAAHAVAPQLQIPAAQVSPVAQFWLHGSGLQGVGITI